jgi:hypothetical protein
MMKGVSFITDENDRKKAVVIDLAVIEKYEEEIEDLLIGIIADARKNEPKVTLDQAIKNLKKSGKLK